MEVFAARATCREGAAEEGISSLDDLPDTVDISTLDLERILREHCVALGVRFVTKAIGTPAQVMDMHPECTRFVAADGAHSRMRTALWGKGHLRRRDIYPSLDFNYEAHGQPDYLRVNTYLSMGHVYAENIGLEKDGTSAVNIRMVVSREQYDALPQATVKSPLVVTSDAPFWEGVVADATYGRTPLQDFQELLALRAEHAGECRTDAPITLTKIHLSQYHARRFARTVEHGDAVRTWFLVGDAAMGMPFYRAVNSGMLLGSQLAYVLTSPHVPHEWAATVYDGLTRPVRIAREALRIAMRETLIKTVKDMARPLLRRASNSSMWPHLCGPVDRLVWRLKYGRRNLSAAAR